MKRTSALKATVKEAGWGWGNVGRRNHDEEAV